MPPEKKLYSFNVKVVLTQRHIVILDVEAETYAKAQLLAIKQAGSGQEPTTTLQCSSEVVGIKKNRR